MNEPAEGSRMLDPRCSCCRHPPVNPTASGGGRDLLAARARLIRVRCLLPRAAKAARSASTRRDIGDFLDYFCAVARRQDIFFLWRPRLRDPGDDMVLEAAVAGRCSHLVTFNERDFEPGEHLGVRVVTPQRFLRTIGVSE